MERRIFIVSALWIAGAGVSIGVSFCQAPDRPAAPTRPLRERLLERALQGDAGAQFDLAKGYEGGRMGLPQDLAQARHWYGKAADQGDPFAEASLGLLFNFGKGGERDTFQAFVLYVRAASHLPEGGDRDTVVEMRDRLAEKLTPQQVAEAHRMAREWKPVSGQQR